MAFLRKIRNNWKKSLFGTCALTYGVLCVKSNYEFSNYMRKMCEEVVKSQAINNNAPPKPILIVLNPAANKRNAENTYKKYCEPLLHTAGYSIELFKTSHMGHAKQYVESLEVLPEAIVVAGGDGTASEVVTGMMRRSGKPCPILVLPLGSGHLNSFEFSSFNPYKDLNLSKKLSGIILRMVEDKFQNRSVLKFNVIEADDNANIKPIYGIDSFSWGLLRDIDAVKDNYWYFGYFRKYVATIMKSFSAQKLSGFKTEFSYTPPCPGCSYCFTTPTAAAVSNQSFLGRLLSGSKTDQSNAQYIRPNENCKQQVEGSIETCQLNIKCNQNEDTYYELETSFFEPHALEKNFFKQIVNVTNNTLEPSKILKARTIKLIPTSEQSSEYYNIDGEEYEVKPIEVSLIPKAIPIFG